MHRARLDPMPAPPTTARGFTLIELTITIAIVAILTAIALPSYRDYVLRGRLVEATNLLSAGRANMERYFQDNRSYQNVTTSAGATLTPPCAATQGLFTMSCSATSATAYTLQARGSGPVATFTFTVDQNGSQTTTVGTGGPWPATSTPLACWMSRRGQTTCP